MKRKIAKRRNRLEGQIEALAKSNPEGALELAQYGRNRSELQKAVWFYLFAREECQKDYGKLDPSGKERTRILQDFAASLCELFLDAVDKRDGEALRTIAAEAEGFKQYPPDKARRRAGILSLKNILDQHEEKMTIAELAGLLNRKLACDPADAPPTDDGHSQLRALARKLKFPIAPDRRGPKN